MALATGSENGTILCAGELEIRPADGLVLATGRPLMLSVREFELLVAMARRSGEIATREQLYAEAWGSELRRGDRSVDVYVSRLREKLAKAVPARRFIHTHPGFGYRFQAEGGGASEEPGLVGDAFASRLRDVHNGQAGD